MIDRVVQLKSAVLAFSKSAVELLGLDRPQAYRPEAHYMRGPGPKWRARYGNPNRTVVVSAQSGGGSRTV